MGANQTPTFREWLADALERSGQSKRGVAKKMAGRHPEGVSNKTIESARRTLNKILNGDLNPTQPTRDTIQEALGRDDAPSVDDEASDAPTVHEAVAQLRNIRRQTFDLERALLGGVQS